MPQEEHTGASSRHVVAKSGNLAAACDALEGIDKIEDSVQPVDEQHRVLERLLAAHEAWFDVTRDYEYAGQRFAGYAEFHSVGEKYVLTKKAKLWEVEANEYLFFALVDELDEGTFTRYRDFMKTEAVRKVTPGPNHMSSHVSLVFVANKVDPTAGKTLQKTAFHKTFKLGFRGWAEFRFCAIDLAEQQVLTNAMGKTMKSALGKNAGFAAPGSRKLFARR